MNLRQQIVQNRIDSLADQLKIGADKAFMRLVHSLVTGKSIHAFDPNDVVDGGQDKQMDAISIEQVVDSADVYILQTKNTTSFSSNELIQLANGLKWMFQRSRKEAEKIGQRFEPNINPPINRISAEQFEDPGNKGMR